MHLENPPLGSIQNIQRVVYLYLAELKSEKSSVRIFEYFRILDGSTNVTGQCPNPPIKDLHVFA